MAASARCFSQTRAIEDAIATDIPRFVRFLLSVRPALAVEDSWSLQAVVSATFGTLSLADVDGLLCSCGDLLEAERADRIIAADAARRAPLRARVALEAAVVGARYVTAEGHEARIEAIAGESCRVRITLGKRRIVRRVLQRADVGPLVLAFDNAQLQARLEARERTALARSAGRGWRS